LHSALQHVSQRTYHFNIPLVGFRFVRTRRLGD
jgi:hypothetical protein